MSALLLTCGFGLGSVMWLPHCLAQTTSVPNCVDLADFLTLLVVIHIAELVALAAVRLVPAPQNHSTTPPLPTLRQCSGANSQMPVRMHVTCSLSFPPVPKPVSPGLHHRPHRSRRCDAARGRVTTASGVRPVGVRPIHRSSSDSPSYLWTPVLAHTSACIK